MDDFYDIRSYYDDYPYDPREPYDYDPMDGNDDDYMDEDEEILDAMNNHGQDFLDGEYPEWQGAAPIYLNGEQV